MVKKIPYYLITVFIFLLYIFIYAPNLNPLYQEGAFLWCVFITIVVIISTLKTTLKEIIDNIKKKKDNNTPFVFKNIEDINLDFNMAKWSIFVIIAIWSLYFLVILGSSTLFNWKAYRDQMSQPVEKEFTSNIQVIDINQVPIVDKKLAYRLADKKLGEKPSLGSQVRLGEPTIQQVNKSLVWVVPLHHSGFFKWITNLSGTPGYIVVSATNAQNVEYVDSHKIKIHPDSYLFDDLERRVRLFKNLFKGIVDYSFELDDEGNPYWVVTTYKNSRGFALPEADGIVLINASSGKIENYSLEDIPDWVDRVQPEDYIMNQINNKGNYVHGIFNFSNKDKFKTSAGSVIIYLEGKCYLFTGITSVGADSSATGFYMVDMVTKEPILYRISGATEYSAMSSAEGKVQDLGYLATTPIILNISEKPTYFLTLKDNEGLIKKYAYVSVQDYSLVEVGDTIVEAENKYKNLLLNSGLSSTKDDYETTDSTIYRISSYIQNQKTMYSFILNNDKNVLYSMDQNISPYIHLSKEGDLVEIKYRNIGDQYIITEFINKTINP